MPVWKTTVTEADVKAYFTYSLETSKLIPVEVEDIYVTVTSAGLSIELKVPAVKCKYKEWSKSVTTKLIQRTNFYLLNLKLTELLLIRLIIKMEQKQ